MHIVGIEVEKHSDLKRVLTQIFRTDPDKIIFIGSAPEYEQMARETGREVEVLPAGAAAPEGTCLIAPHGAAPEPMSPAPGSTS